MLKNMAGQHVGAQMNAASDGSGLTSNVAVHVVVDGGTYDDAAGTLTHKGGGYWDYVPTVGETNGTHVAFHFTHATGIAQVVNVYPEGSSPIKQNTAFSNFEFPMFLNSDHISPATGLSVSGVVSLDGADFVSCVGSVVEVQSSAVYKTDLGSADLNGAISTFKWTAPGADQVVMTILTHP